MSTPPLPAPSMSAPSLSAPSLSGIDTTSLVFFGDSLSDQGNLYAQTEGILPPRARDTIGDADGQISNGPVWSQQIGAVLGSETVLNYAVAGAEAVGTQALGAFLAESVPPRLFLVEPDDPALDWDMNLSAQIDRFLADTAGQTDVSHTAVILIGGNDFATLDYTQDVAAVLEAAQPIADAVQASTLAAVSTLLTTAGSGVAQVVVVTMPPISFFAAFADLDPADLAQYDALIAEMNAGITADVAALNDSLGGAAVVVVVDFDLLATALADDPGAFGLVAPASQTLTGDAAELAAFDADQVMFWDDLHPTEATHGVIAGFTAAAIEGRLVTLTDADDDLSADGSDAMVLFAYDGADRVRAGDGDDIVFGGSGDDHLLGMAGDDQLSGGSDNDLVRGRSGVDVLDGSQGDDLLIGSVGNDVIIDGTGSDIAFGGLGDDTFIWVEESLMGGAGGSSDTFYGLLGEDTLYIVLSTESFDTYAQDLAGAGRTDALAALGLTAHGIGAVVVLEERDSLSVLSDQGWYAEADLWGLV